MRPPANRRKNIRTVEKSGTPQICFNEAACEQAEEPLEETLRDSYAPGFNEAACEQAEERKSNTERRQPFSRLQ